jgi:single-stranded-DNA-specific exonuclease
METLLKVERSLMQARWVFAPVAQDEVEQIARRHGLPEIIARLLCARNVPADGIERFLHPKLASDFPDPLSMAGMDEAAAYLAQAIQARRKIAVFGDFDVDGATSTAVMVRFLRHCGLDVPFYIPDRMAEGYGPNIDALKALKEQGAEIVILVDCGTTSFDVIAQARAIGLEIVVLDHHEAEDRLPDANHVINPKRRDDRSGLSMLAACGVSFMTCVAVNAKLRAAGFFKAQGRVEAPLKDWLDIVALGTVCDMVPLSGVNRLFVRAGFALMAKRNNPGIKALCEVGGVKGDPTPYHAGFVLGPRINAGSRVHQANLGARLLCTDDAEEARNIAFTLEDCNGRRKEIQQEMFAQAIGMVEAKALHQQPIIVVGHEDWHPGLSGLVAGHLKERYKKPAVVVTYTPGSDGKPEGRGSGRSVAGVNLGAAFIEARNKGLLVKGGGHAMAAGFTILPGQLDAFTKFLLDQVGQQMEGKEAFLDTPIDGLLSVRGARADLARMIQEHIGPFGMDHPEPVFALANVRLHMVDVIGTDHVRCMVSDWEGGARMKAIAFRAADTPLGRALLKHGSSGPVHLAGTLKLDTWNGEERVELHIQDAALCS